MGVMLSLPPAFYLSAAIGLFVALAAFTAEAEFITIGGIGWTLATLNAMVMRVINRYATHGHVQFGIIANATRFFVTLMMIIAAGLILYETHFLALALPFLAGFFVFLCFEIAGFMA